MRPSLSRRVSLAPILFVAATVATSAQSPAPQAAGPPDASATTAHSFEVTSIHQMPPDTCCYSMSKYPSNRFSAQDVSLASVIAIAYGFNQKHLAGEADWVDSQTWSIDAKVEGDAELTADQMKPLLQQFLKTRFHLTVHHESRAISGYELVVAKGGSKLTTSSTDEKAHGYIFSSGMDFARSPVSGFAAALEFPTGKPVIDHTGLTGSYNITLKYAPPNDPNANSELPDIFTAIQEQLGLKLVPAKVPVDYLVIDHIDRTPTEN